jgi:hypothetical protein
METSIQGTRRSGVAPTAHSPRSTRRVARRQPPYATRLADILTDPGSWPRRPGTSADGTTLTLWLLAGQEAWPRAHDWVNSAVPFLLAPPGEDPSCFDWGLLAGHLPVLVAPCGHLGQAEVAALVGALVRDGVARVLVLHPAGPRLYRAGGHHG